MVERLYPVWLDLLGQRSEGIDSERAASDIVRYIAALRLELAERAAALDWMIDRFNDFPGQERDTFREALCEDGWEWQPWWWTTLDLEGDFCKAQP